MYFISAASCQHGPLRLPLANIVENECMPLSTDEKTSLVNRYVMGVEAWHPGHSQTLLRDSLLSACASANIQPDELNMALFSCTLAMTHYPMGKSLIRSILRKLNLNIAYLNIGGHQCCGTILSIQSAIRHLRANPYWKHIAVLTSDCVDFTSRRLLPSGIAQGDAASTIIISRDAGRFQILGTSMCSDYQQYDLSLPGENDQLKYFFGMRRLVSELLKQTKISVDNVDLVIPHLSHPETWDRMMQILKCKGRLLMKKEMNTTGHLFGSDLALGLQCLAERNETSKLAMGLSYGLGASWGGLLVKM